MMSEASVHSGSKGRQTISGLRAFGREARAFARVAALLPYDRRPLLPALVEPGDDVVVLIHGLLATAGVMRPLRHRIELLDRAYAASFTYSIGAGVEEVARALRGLLAKLPSGVRIHLVGHSVGGIVARWYVQQTAPDAPVAQTISVASPFGGARGAWLMPGQAGRDIRAGSWILTQLSETAGCRPEVPHLSIYGSADTAASPTTVFPAGERVIIDGCGHNALLFHPTVAEIVIERILSPRQGGEPMVTSRA